MIEVAEKQRAQYLHWNFLLLLPSSVTSVIWSHKVLDFGGMAFIIHRILPYNTYFLDRIYRILTTLVSVPADFAPVEPVAPVPEYLGEKGKLITLIKNDVKLVAQAFGGNAVGSATALAYKSSKELAEIAHALASARKALKVVKAPALETEAKKVNFCARFSVWPARSFVCAGTDVWIGGTMGSIQDQAVRAPPLKRTSSWRSMRCSSALRNWRAGALSI